MVEALSEDDQAVNIYDGSRLISARYGGWKTVQRHAARARDEDLIDIVKVWQPVATSFS